MNWTFKPHGTEKMRNPLADEFFTDPELSSNATALIREAVQNSLDARKDSDSPVSIRIKVGKISDKSQVSEYFEGLEKHTSVALGSSGQLPNSFNYLVYEDFNTSGLWGDSRVLKANGSLPKEDQSYTYFVHVEGEGSKGEGKKGKWGVGKIVFPMLSQLKSYFAYSVRDPEKAPCGNPQVLIGQSILKYHDIGEVTYQADGWMANMVNDVPQPLTGSDAREFAKKWGISREADETGLSLVVPVTREGIGISELRDAVIRQYFISILSGDLEATFEDESGHRLYLNRENFLEFLDNIQTLNPGSSRDLSTDQVRTGIAAFSDAVAVADFLEVVIPRFGADQIVEDIPSQVIADAAKSLEDANVAIFKVFIDVPKPKSTDFVRDSFEVLLAPLPGKNPIVFSREGILVPGTKAVNVKDYLAIVLMDEGPLADLLGWAEGPAHEDWRPDTKLLKENFHHSAKSRNAVANVIRLVRNYPKRIVEEINRIQSAGLDTEAFSDWFAFVEPRNKRKKLDDVEPPIIDPPKPKSSDDRLSVTVSGGDLKVAKGPGKNDKGDLVEIRLAYSVAKGNAFTKWDELDFELAGPAALKMEKLGIRDLIVIDNQLSFSIEDPSSWSLKVLGFEAYRDIEVHSKVTARASREG